MTMTTASCAFPAAGTELTHLLVVSRRGGLAALVRGGPRRDGPAYGGTSVVLKLLGQWLLLVTGGEPTADKPTVTFAAPPDPDTVSAEMIFGVTDCRAVYETLLSRAGGVPHAAGRVRLGDPGVLPRPGRAPVRDQRAAEPPGLSRVAGGLEGRSHARSAPCRRRRRRRRARHRPTPPRGSRRRSPPPPRVRRPSRRRPRRAPSRSSNRAPRRAPGPPPPPGRRATRRCGGPSGTARRAGRANRRRRSRSCSPRRPPRASGRDRRPASRSGRPSRRATPPTSRSPRTAAACPPGGRAGTRAAGP